MTTDPSRAVAPAVKEPHVERLQHRLRLKLIFIGFIIGMKGFAYLTSSTAATDAALTLPRHVMPVEAWGVLIIAAAAVAVLCGRWPRTLPFGYAILSGLSLGWAFCYGLAPLDGGPTSAIQGCLSWCAIGGFVIFLGSDKGGVAK